MAVDFRKWFDRMQPQTLQIATWLLYIDGVFALLAIIDRAGVEGYLIRRYDLGIVVVLAVVVLYALGGLLMANDLRIGWRIAVAASISPFVLNVLGTRSALSTFGFGSPVGIYDHLTGRIFGGGTIGLIFDVALVALLLHNQSREHQRIWFH
ncbi:MAG: hypothetical protein ACKOFZ_04625 [Ilumatobacteraceae bacterium]